MRTFTRGNDDRTIEDRVSSERLFSTAGDVCGDERTCLLADNIERLVFLKANVMKLSPNNEQ